METTNNPKISFSPNISANVVRVSIPADIHADLDKFQKVQKDILGKLGCLGCCSGWDIRYNIQRQFVINQALDVKEVIS